MIKRRLLALSALILLFIPSFAWAVEFSGNGKAAGTYYVNKGDEDEPRWLLWSTLGLKAEERFGDTALAGSLRFESISDCTFTYSFDPADRGIARPAISLGELWVRTPVSEAIDLKAGRFYVGWGKTDGYSPADAFLPRDLTDPFADEKLPLWALRLLGQWDWLRVEGVYVAVTTPWRLPQLGGRGAPLDFPQEILADHDQDPPKRGFGALRALGTLGPFDFGLWGRYGVRPAPLLEFIPDYINGKVRVERTFAEEWGVGGEVSLLLGGWVARGELAGLFSDDERVGDALIWAAGLERGWESGTLLLTLADKAGEKGEKDVVLYDRAMLPLFIAAWNQTTEWGGLKAVWSAGLARGDGLVKLEAWYNLTDNLKAGGETDWCYGPKEGAFGALADASRLLLTLSYLW